MTQHSFIKMHGIANDFIIFDERQNAIKLSKKQVKHLCDRHVGIGCDQLIIVAESNKANIEMKIFNPDGSTSGACGNATRCVAMLYMDETNKSEVSIEVAGNVLRATRSDRQNIISVDMGQPRLKWNEIPIAKECDTLAIDISDHENKQVAQLRVGTAVNIGNPHVVFFVEDLNKVDLEVVGPIIEHHPLFPERVNVNLAQITSEGDINLKVWERGAGETLACGSGACATAVAAMRLGRIERSCSVHLPGGGTLHIDWQEEDGRVVMTGEAEISYTGVVNI